MVLLKDYPIDFLPHQDKFYKRFPKNHQLFFHCIQDHPSLIQTFKYILDHQIRNYFQTSTLYYYQLDLSYQLQGL